MRVLDLFSGIGGFALACERVGAQTVAFAEIATHANRVLAHRFPDVPNLGDVTSITGRDVLNCVGPVDLVTGGFPCQDLSIAGKRGGLKGERSGLFWEIIRIVREMQEALHGPTWLVLENVPGLLSSHGGRDFACVLSGLAELRPLDLVWGVLDARFFGVPQRRRRVFIVADFGGRRAAEVLALAESVRGDSAPRGSARQDPGAATGDGAAGGGELLNPHINDTLTVGADQTTGFIGPVVAGTLGGGSGTRAWCNDTDRMTFVPMYAPTLKRRYAKGIETTVDTDPIVAYAPPLADPIVTGEQRTYTHEGTHNFRTRNVVAFSAKDHGNDAAVELAPTLRAMPHDTSHANGGGQLAVAFAENQRAEVLEGDMVRNITSGGGKPGQGYSAVRVWREPRHPLANKDLDHANATEADAREILRELRDAIGAEAFAIWQTDVAAALQSPEILQQRLHEPSVAGKEPHSPASAPRQRTDQSAETKASGPVRGVRGAERKGRASSEPGHGRQPPREPPEDLSGLSQSPTSTTFVLSDLWTTQQGLWVLREALSAIQEMGRPADAQGQPVCCPAEREHPESDQVVPGRWLRSPLSREWILQQARAASETRNALNAAQARKEVEGSMVVRRLTPL